MDGFDAERCKSLLATDRWPSYTITYWSHTWDDLQDSGHAEDNLAAVEEKKAE